VSSLIPSSRPTPMPKPPEPPLLLLKKKLMPGEMDSLLTLDQSLHTLKCKTQLIMTLTPLPSISLPMNLRKDKINTMLEFFGETNKKKITTPGEVLHGLQPRKISD